MLKVSNLSISFNGNEVFNDINFILNDRDKLGLIGRNGCGKSTLLKILSGELEQDSGTIVKTKNMKIGFLRQHLDFREKTIVDEVNLSLPDYKKDFYWESEKMLIDLGFSQEDLNRPASEFSGGWQIKLNLAKLLIAEPDLLLLDEPTNYLDIASIRWFKRFLQELEKSFILITHDRGFMDEVVNGILIIHRGTSKQMAGNTQDMYDKIAKEEEIYEKTRLNENKKREQLQRYIDRFRYKSTLASRVQDKVKMLARQEQKEELSTIQNLEFTFNYREIIGNSPLLSVKDLTFGYEKDRILIKNLSFEVKKGDRFCIIGKNGKGKSTLLKLLVGELYQNSGEIKVNYKVHFAYFGQMNINRLNLNNTIEEELWEVDKTLTRSRILNIAGVMMFSGDASAKRLSVLSGGEKSRVLLGKLILQPSNLLLLDEPTNHLDMESCISLVDALSVFKGSSITVTHNEELIHRIATKLIVFDDDKVFYFDGTYQEFLDRVGWSYERDEMTSRENKAKSTSVIEKPVKTSDKKKKQIAKLEEELLELEIELEERVLSGDYAVAELQKQIEELNKKIAETREDI